MDDMKYYTFANFLKRSISMDMYLHFGQKNVFPLGLNGLIDVVSKTSSAIGSNVPTSRTT